MSDYDDYALPDLDQPVSPDFRPAPAYPGAGFSVPQPPQTDPGATDSLLQSLNPPQREAVETSEGPLLVLAGAGTGKTKVLTSRLAYLLMQRRAGPGQILAVTFTNKAAKEMRERVAAILGFVSDNWWIGTFHALAARILRSHAELVGLKPNFSILDFDDQIRLMKQIISAEQLDSKRWPARLLLGVIERWKDRGLGPEKIAANDPQSGYANGRMLDIYRLYQERLRVLNACDFGDLLLHNLSLFIQQPDIAKRWQEKFHYILVDEYQDTNVAQYLWLRLLAQGHKNICCVGDEDQSIYGWRGAEIANILRFEKDFTGSKIVRLEQNYRSTGHILAAASGLIAQNEGRYGKTLWTAAEDGEKVSFTAVWDAPEEARRVGEIIEDFQRQGQSLSDIAILVRAGFQMRNFEERFNTMGIPYRVFGGPRFYERQEIRDALAYLRVIAQPDDDLAFERIINKPKRGFGNSSLRILHDAARVQGRSLSITALSLVETDELRGAARRNLKALIEDFARWRSLAEQIPHTDLAQQVLDESGYTAMWQADKSVEAPGRLENLKELIQAMGEFDSLPAFLDHVSLVMETQDTAQEAQVTIMTLHGAKGLEFDIVFLPGWEEGLFPSQRSMDENGLAGLEEERRLAYVGLTRARKRSLIFQAANRQVNGQWNSALPSRFLTEIPGEHLEIHSENGLFGGPVHGKQGGAWMAMQDAPPFQSQSSHRSFQNRQAASSRQGPMAAPGRAPTAAPVIEGQAYHLSTTQESAYKVGDRVFHQKFGYGHVTSTEGDKLHIAFEKSGDKKVVAGFVKPASEA